MDYRVRVTRPLVLIRSSASVLNRPGSCALISCRAASNHSANAANIFTPCPGSVRPDVSSHQLPAVCSFGIHVQLGVNNNHRTHVRLSHPPVWPTGRTGLRLKEKSSVCLICMKYRIIILIIIIISLGKI